jgi:hypothetical protein
MVAKARSKTVTRPGLNSLYIVLLGRGASLAKSIPAGELVRRLWDDAQALLR